jgi:ribonuclease HI
MDDPELEAVVELERRLLDPRVRRDRRAVTELLHEDFREVGASGRVFDRRAIVESLAAGGGTSAHASDFRAVRLGPDAVLLTYRTDTPSLRSSVWCRGEDGAWRMLHHQGTRGAG